MLRAYIDVETTGLERSKGACIIEVGAVIYAGATELASYTSLCNPGAAALDTPAADNALQINKISAEDILAAPPTADIAAALKKFMVEFAEDDAVLHAYNVNFDSKFLEVEPWSIDKARWGECVMIAAQQHLKLARSVKLEVAAAHFSLAPIEGHRALPDARRCAQIHQAILIARAS